MPIPRLSSLIRVCLPLALLLCLPGSAEAATIVAKLRVEGPSTTLDFGTSYATAEEFIQRGADPSCAPAPNPLGVPRPTALGILGSAEEVAPDLRPVRAAEDEFGVRVCQVGGLVETDNPFTGWLYRVNHAAPTFSPSLRGVGPNDEVLWYFANFSRQVNSGDELVLEAPVRVTPGSFAVRVIAYDFEGKASPAPDGTVVSGGDAPVTTSGGGAVVSASQPGEIVLRASRGEGAIPSNVQEVCVNADLSRCPAFRGETVFGTNERDVLVGVTRGPDVIRARGGRDRVNVRGGGSDQVNCGRGRDRAILGKGDRARRCEKTRRR